MCESSTKPNTPSTLKLYTINNPSKINNKWFFFHKERLSLPVHTPILEKIKEQYINKLISY
jgi:hypothetical protein